MSAVLAGRPRRLAWRLRSPAWLLLPAAAFFAFFYLAPLIDLLRLSFAEGSGLAGLAHYERVFSVQLYGESLVRTFGIAGAVTALCAFFGYPTALLIHRSRGGWRLALTAAVVLPYFVSVLIRTYAWMVLLGRNGPINKLLLAFGLIDSPLPLIFNRASVLISISAVLLPLMVLTVLGGLARLDPLAARAAATSGAAPLSAFWRVLFPQTLPGLLAGALLVFISTTGFFITPSLLGGPADQMFAMHITQQADFAASGGFLQALAVLLLGVTLLLIAVAGRLIGLDFIWGGERRPRAASAVRSASTDWARARGRIAAIVADTIGWPLLRGLDRLPRWVGGAISVGVAVFALATLLVPIAVAALISFGNAVYMTFPPPAYSLRWYGKFLSDATWTRALLTSVGIGAVSALASVLLGSAAAFALVRSRLRATSLWMAFLVSPLIVPGVVLGLSLYSLFLRTDLLGTVWGLAAAHALGGTALLQVIGVALVYNRQAFPSKRYPKIWADFWNVKDYPGKRCLPNWSRFVFEAALLADGVAPSKLYPVDFDRALRKIAEIKPHVVKWWLTNSQAPQLLLDGEASACLSYTGPVARLKKEDVNAPLEMTWDGAFTYYDFFSIPRNAPHPDAVLELLSYRLDAHRAARVAEATSVALPSPRVYAAADPKLRDYWTNSPQVEKTAIKWNAAFWGGKAPDGTTNEEYAQQKLNQLLAQ